MDNSVELRKKNDNYEAKLEKISIKLDKSNMRQIQYVGGHRFVKHIAYSGCYSDWLEISLEDLKDLLGLKKATQAKTFHHDGCLFLLNLLERTNCE